MQMNVGFKCGIKLENSMVNLLFMVTFKEMCFSMAKNLDKLNTEKVMGEMVEIVCALLRKLHIYTQNKRTNSVE